MSIGRRNMSLAANRMGRLVALSYSPIYLPIHQLRECAQCDNLPVCLQNHHIAYALGKVKCAASAFETHIRFEVLANKPAWWSLQRAESAQCMHAYSTVTQHEPWRRRCVQRCDAPRVENVCQHTSMVKFCMC